MAITTPSLSAVTLAPVTLSPASITPVRVTPLTFGPNSPWESAGTFAKREHVKDLGDLILGTPFIGTRQLQNTLDDNGFGFLKPIPVINSLAGALFMTKERFIDPMIQGKPGVALVNTLETAGYTADTLSNIVKSLFPGAGGGSLEDLGASLGLTSGYRKQYQWDTGNFLLDIILETVSDPINWVTFGSKQIMKSTSEELTEELKEKVIAKIGREAYEEYGEAIIKDAIKASALDVNSKEYSELISAIKQRMADSNKIEKLITKLNLSTDTAANAYLRKLAAFTPEKLLSEVAELSHSTAYRWYSGALKANLIANKIDKGLSVAGWTIGTPFWPLKALYDKASPYLKHSINSMHEHLKEVTLSELLNDSEGVWLREATNNAAQNSAIYGKYYKWFNNLTEEQLNNRKLENIYREIANTFSPSDRYNHIEWVDAKFLHKLRTDYPIPKTINDKDLLHVVQGVRDLYIVNENTFAEIVKAKKDAWKELITSPNRVNELVSLIEDKLPLRPGKHGTQVKTTWDYLDGLVQYINSQDNITKNRIEQYMRSFSDTLKTQMYQDAQIAMRQLQTDLLSKPEIWSTLTKEEAKFMQATFSDTQAMYYLMNEEFLDDLSDKIYRINDKTLGKDAYNETIELRRRAYDSHDNYFNTMKYDKDLKKYTEPNLKKTAYYYTKLKDIDWEKELQSTQDMRYATDAPLRQTSKTRGISALTTFFTQRQIDLDILYDRMEQLSLLKQDINAAGSLLGVNLFNQRARRGLAELITKMRQGDANATKTLQEMISKNYKAHVGVNAKLTIGQKTLKDLFEKSLSKIPEKYSDLAGMELLKDISRPLIEQDQATVGQTLTRIMHSLDTQLEDLSEYTGDYTELIFRQFIAANILGEDNTNMLMESLTNAQRYINFIKEQGVDKLTLEQIEDLQYTLSNLSYSARITVDSLEEWMSNSNPDNFVKVTELVPMKTGPGLIEVTAKALAPEQLTYTIQGIHNVLSSKQLDAVTNTLYTVLDNVEQLYETELTHRDIFEFVTKFAESDPMYADTINLILDSESEFNTLMLNAVNQLRYAATYNQKELGYLHSVAHDLSATLMTTKQVENIKHLVYFSLESKNLLATYESWADQLRVALLNDNTLPFSFDDLSSKELVKTLVDNIDLYVDTPIYDTIKQIRFEYLATQIAREEELYIRGELFNIISNSNLSMANFGTELQNIHAECMASFSKNCDKVSYEHLKKLTKDMDIELFGLDGLKQAHYNYVSDIVLEQLEAFNLRCRALINTYDVDMPLYVLYNDHYLNKLNNLTHSINQIYGVLTGDTAAIGVGDKALKNLHLIVDADKDAIAQEVLNYLARFSGTPFETDLERVDALLQLGHGSNTYDSMYLAQNSKMYDTGIDLSGISKEELELSDDEMLEQLAYNSNRVTTSNSELDLVEANRTLERVSTSTNQLAFGYTVTDALKYVADINEYYRTNKMTVAQIDSLFKITREISNYVTQTDLHNLIRQASNFNNPYAMATAYNIGVRKINKLELLQEFGIDKYFFKGVTRDINNAAPEGIMLSEFIQKLNNAYNTTDVLFEPYPEYLEHTIKTLADVDPEVKNRIINVYGHDSDEILKRARIYALWSEESNSLIIEQAKQILNNLRLTYRTSDVFFAPRYVNSYFSPFNLTPKQVIAWDIITRDYTWKSINTKQLLNDYLTRFKEQKFFDMENKAFDIGAKFQDTLQKTLDPMTTYYMFENVHDLAGQLDEYKINELLTRLPIGSHAHLIDAYDVTVNQLLKDSDSLSTYIDEITAMTKAGSDNVNKLRTLDKLNKDTRTVAQALGTKYTDNIDRLKIFNIYEDTPMNSPQVQRYILHERANVIASNLTRMTPEQLRAFVDNFTDGYMFISNPEELAFVNKIWSDELLKEVGLEQHVIELADYFNSLENSEWGSTRKTITMLKRTDNNIHEFNYEWIIPEMLFEEQQETIDETVNLIRKQYDMSNMQIPTRLMNGDYVDESLCDKITTSEKLQKYFGDKEIQKTYLNLDERGRSNFFKKKSYVPDFMFVGVNAFNNVLDIMESKDIDFAENFYRRSNTASQRVLNSGINAIKRVDGFNKYTQIVFNDDFYSGNQMFHKLLDNMSDKEIAETFKKNDWTAAILRLNKNGEPRVYKYHIFDKASLETARKAKAVILPTEIYRNAVLSINERKINSPILRFLTRVVSGTFKTMYLSTPGFLFRNALDSLVVKNLNESGSIWDAVDTFKYEAKAMRMYKLYDEITKASLEKTHENTINKNVLNSILKNYSIEDQKLFRLSTIYFQSMASSGYTQSLSDFLIKMSTKDIIYDGTKFEQFWQEQVLPRLMMSKQINKVNNGIEGVARLGLFYKLIDEGKGIEDAVKQVVKVHFDYDFMSNKLSAIQEVFWFSTFPLMNTMYYLNGGITNNPSLLKLQLDMMEQSWNSGDYTWDKVKQNDYLTYNALAGNLRLYLTKNGGSRWYNNILLKTGSSALDAMNVLFNPIGEALDRVNPFIAVLFGLEDVSELNPFKGAISRAKRLVTGKSLVPSIYDTLYPKIKRRYQSSTKVSNPTWRYTKPRKNYNPRFNAQYVRRYKLSRRRYYMSKTLGNLGAMEPMWVPKIGQKPRKFVKTARSMSKRLVSR